MSAALTLSWALARDSGGDAEAQLVRRAGQGDRAAFGELYARYARVVHGILLARVPPAEAEDLTHEVFLAAMDRLGGLRDPEAFRSWLLSIARRRATDWHRRTREQVDLDGEAFGAGAAQPARVEAMDALEAIRALPEAYRETLILRLVEGLTGPEIADRTGLRPESVRVNLCRGMKLLRERLEGGRP